MSAQVKKVIAIRFRSMKLTTPQVSFMAIFGIFLFSLVSFLWPWNSQETAPKLETKTETVTTAQLVSAITLPSPILESKMSLERTLKLRRSQRSFTTDPLSLKHVSQLLWAAQGVTSDWGGRTAPSAKSVYPLTLYLVSYKISDLNTGLYRYLPGEREPLHKIILVKPGDFRESLAAIVGQNSLSEAPAVLVITGNMAKMAAAFENVNSDKEVYLESGHASQNVYLEATSLSLGTVTLTTTESEKIAETLGIPAEETVIYLMPIGFPKL